MRWSNAGSHEVVSMLGLASRVGTTTERSPASLVPLSVTMDGLHVLQLVPKRFSRCKLFMSQISVNLREVKRALDYQCSDIIDGNRLVLGPP